MTELEGKADCCRWRILAVVLLSPFMGTLDASIVNVILPVMAKRFNTDLGGIQWVVTSYLIVLSALILIFGKMADRIGKTRVFTWGFLVFGTGSFLCALSTSLSFLVVSRILQAAGAAMFMSSNQGIIADAFPAKERGRALGLLGGAVAVGTMSGPPLGGFLAAYFDWQSVFLINIPISLFAFTAGFAVFRGLGKEVKRDETISRKADFFGAICLLLSVTLVFWSLLNIHELEIDRVWIYGAFIFGAAFFILLIMIERSSEEPLIALALFRIPFFSLSLLCSFLSYLVMFSVTIIHPFYLQNVRHLSSVHAGVLMLAFPLTTFFVAPLSGYISDRSGARPVTATGLMVMLCGLLLLAVINEHSSYPYIIFASIVLGCGQGIFQSPNTAILMALSPPDKYGITGSINAFARNLGMVSGITFGVSLLYFLMQNGGHANNASAPIFVAAMRQVYLAAALLCAGAVCLTIFRLKKFQ